jgi:biotin-(acetyl-CoA carboxylase) ligase
VGLGSQSRNKIDVKNFFLDCCSSTHMIAKDLLKSDNIDNVSLELGIQKEQINEIINQQENFFLSAKTMSAGVTRKDGVCWFAPRGNIYLTIVLFKKNLHKNNNQADKLLTNFEIISTTAVATYLYIEQFIGNLAIKWPNDILASGKKIAGIMSENLSGCIILSLSFNNICKQITTNLIYIF